MNLVITKDKTIHEVQQDFSLRFPFLKLEFYKLSRSNSSLRTKEHLSCSTSLKAAGLTEDSGAIDISDDMTVADLEKTFRKKYGLDVQVSRKSGMIWLETTMTDKWSLKKQNEHGREISLTAKEFPSIEPIQGNG